MPGKGLVRQWLGAVVKFPRHLTHVYKARNGFYDSFVQSEYKSNSAQYENM